MQMNWKFFIKRILNRFRLRFLPSVIPIHEQIDRIQTTDREYFAWLVQHKLKNPNTILAQQLTWNRFRSPMFSILVPVFNTPEAWLKECALSVIQQTFPGWELLLSDDASTDEVTKNTLINLSSLSSRIRILNSDKNKGISAATNHVANRARGKFLVFLDHDDLLSNDALEKLHLSILEHKEGDVFYSDEDRLSVTGHRYRHHFKPHFSPSLLEMCNYMLHLMCVRKECFNSLGGLRPEFDGSQDYDLLLRLFDAKARFIHVADILYTWRESEASMSGGAEKPEIFYSGKKALLEHINRRNESGTIKDNPLTELGDYWIQFELPKSISITIISNREKIESIPGRYKVIIETIDPEDLFLTKNKEKLRQKADVVLFLADNASPENWELFLDELIGWALRKDIGIVGARVLSTDDSILHAGLSLLPSSYLRLDFEGNSIQHSSIAKRLRDCIAVSGTALAVEWCKLMRYVDEGAVSAESWDIELCLRASKNGHRVVYNPHAMARIENGTIPHTLLPSKQEILRLLNRYSVTTDPYLNPHLTSKYNDFRLPDQLPIHQHTAPPSLKKHPDLTNLNTGSSLKFSLIMPIYKGNLVFFEEMVGSILDQTYSNFEVCICSDASQHTGMFDYLFDLEKRDPRFIIDFSKDFQGLANVSNRCLKMVTGGFVVFCNQDDRLEPFSLQMLADYIHTHPETDIAYSDEDVINADGSRHSPHYRPDWNPDLFMSQMYFSHLFTIRTILLKKIRGFNTRLSGAHNYDLVLRATEQARHIGHIPEVMYSSRSQSTSPSKDASRILNEFNAGLKALRDAVSRRKEEAKVIHAPGTALGVFRVKRTIRKTTISHIIAARNKAIFDTIENIQEITKIEIEIIVILPCSEKHLIDKLRDTPNVVADTIPDDSPRAAYYNHGASISASDILIFSPQTVHILEGEYPNALLEHTNRKSIGAVGCKLLYPNGFYYHTGIILGVNGISGYAHRNTWQGPGYWYYANCIRNYSAVSWDLLAVNRENWGIVGGFDEALPKFSDIDFCLKLANKGFQHVYTPYITGMLNRNIHRLEELRNPEAEEIISKRYIDTIHADPYYNPHLSKEKEDFSCPPI